MMISRLGGPPSAVTDGRVGESPKVITKERERGDSSSVVIGSTVGEPPSVVTDGKVDGSPRVMTKENR